MPSTARITISQHDQIVTESLDDVWNTQYGRHISLSLVAGADTPVSWPTTGEKYCYIRVKGTVGTISIKPTGAASAWVSDLSVEGTPFLLPKPNAVAGFVLNASAAAECSMVLF